MCRLIQIGLAELVRKRLRRHVHRSVAEFPADFTAFIDAHNEKLQTGNHAASAEQISVSIKGFRFKANELGVSEEA